MSDILNIVEHIGETLAGDLLTGLEKADEVLAAALDAMGDGIEWTGEEVEKLAALVASLAPKLEALKQKLGK